MKRKIRVLGETALVAVLLATLGSCSGSTLKGYAGPDLADDQTAVIRSGAYTRIEACDGVKVGSSYFGITVLPGSHIVSVGFVKRAIGNKLLYPTQTASVAFVAKAGRKYIVYAAPVPDSSWQDIVVSSYKWVGYVTDEKSGEQIAETEPLPLKIEHISPLYYQSNTLY